jgi:hypothetical protein
MNVLIAFLLVVLSCVLIYAFYRISQCRDIVNALEKMSNNPRSLIKVTKKDDPSYLAPYQVDLKYTVGISSSQVNPIVLIPGIGGTQINGNWNKNNLFTLCYSKGQNDAIWVTTGAFFASPCWKTLFRVGVSNSSGVPRWYQTDSTVTTSINPMGSLTGIDTLFTIGGFNVFLAYYMHELIKGLKSYISNTGLNADNYVYGAGYDFRLIGDDTYTNNWCNQLKDLVQRVYSSTGKKVSLMAHSLGGLVTMIFLSRQTQTWKNTYIHSFIPVNVPFGGAPKITRSIVSGYNFEFQGKDEEYTDVIRPLASSFLLQPQQIFNHNIVKTPSKVYNVPNLTQMYNDMYFSTGATAYTYLRNKYHNNLFYIFPGVKSYAVVSRCINASDLVTGSGRGTEMAYSYSSNLTNGSLVNPTYTKETYIYNNVPNAWVDYLASTTSISKDNMIGDLTVPFLSLRGPLVKWTYGTENANNFVRIKEMVGNADVSHMKVLSNSGFITYIFQVISNQV